MLVVVAVVRLRTPIEVEVVCIEPEEILELDEFVLPRLLDVAELLTVAVVPVPLDSFPFRSRLLRVLATGLVVFVAVVLPEEAVCPESATSIELDVEAMELELVEVLSARLEEEDKRLVEGLVPSPEEEEPTELELVEGLVPLLEEEKPTELELVEGLVPLPEEEKPTELELVEGLVPSPEEEKPTELELVEGLVPSPEEERSDEERLEDDEKLEDDDETSPPSDSIEIESTPPVSTSPNSALSRFTSTSTSAGVSVRDVSGIGSMLDKLPLPDGSLVVSEFGSVPCKSVAISPSSVLSSRISSRLESPPSIGS